MYVCGKREATVKSDRKPVTYTIGLWFASSVFHTTFEITLKLIIHVI